MVYTEIKERNGRKYFYRVLSVRKGEKISKLRKYLGTNLSKSELLAKERDADKIISLTLINVKKRVVEEIKSKIIGILIKNRVKRAGIFGSYARGDYKKGSDIDILIEPPEGMGFGFAGLEIQLSNKLNKKIDLVSYKGISPYLKDKILSEEVRII